MIGADYHGHLCARRTARRLRIAWAVAVGAVATCAALIAAAMRADIAN